MNANATLHAIGVLQHPPFLLDGIVYMTKTGSVAYGCATADSDVDIVGACVPPRHYLWPQDEIAGFSTPGPRFDVWQAHHVNVSDGVSCDLSVYSIARLVRLMMDNNPNALDVLFSPDDCVIASSPAWAIIRDARRLFVHKGCYHKMRGYAHSQLHKIRTASDADNVNVTSQRRALIKRHGYDTKFAYHVVRLALECGQLLVDGEMDLRRDADLYAAIRNGAWTLGDILTWWKAKESELADLYASSTLPHSPDESVIAALLTRAIEEYHSNPQVRHQGLSQAASSWSSRAKYSSTPSAARARSSSSLSNGWPAKVL